MRRKLTKVGNSMGLILSKDLLDVLGISGTEIEVEVAGNTLVLASPDIDPGEIEAGLAYIASKRERAEVYRRLAE